MKYARNWRWRNECPFSALKVHLQVFELAAKSVLKLNSFILAPYPTMSPLNPFMNNPFLRKPKRIRTAFTPAQLMRLEQEFKKNQ